ncbi:MAG: aspartate/glutamate racemase family protein [Magnetovibrio sp.]|nr:aspartate/glutamate racemase family protein [Magnetovibrio sp.]
MAPRIALFHATQAAIAPIETAFAELWPEADCWNLLDEGLSHEIDRSGGLTEALMARFIGLAEYAAQTGVDAILFTCSAFGPAIEECQRRFDIPALKPNEALLEAALEAGPALGLIATHPPTLPVMTAQLEALAGEHGRAADISPRLAEGAWEALKAGDREAHDGAVVAAARDVGDCDAILLAQFSMAPLAARVAAEVTAPVLTSPHAAVRKLLALLGGA